MSTIRFEIIEPTPGEQLITVLERGGIQSLIDPAHPTKAVAPYLQAFDAATPATTKRALMIGAGAFAGPIHFVAEHPHCSLVAVEINPAYLEAAEKLGFFVTEFPQLTPVIADGMRYLETCLWQRDSASAAETPKAASERAFEFAPYLATCTEFGPFDIIFVDAFKGLSQEPMFSSAYGITLLKKNLSAKGRVAFNIATSFINPKPLFALKEALSEHFTHVEVLKATFYEVASKDNFVVVASDTALDLPDAIEV